MLSILGEYLNGIKVIRNNNISIEDYALVTLNNYEELKNIIGNFDFIQENVSRSIKNTIRGLHYQSHPKSQGKLVSVIMGEILDVAVDIRKNSSSFGKTFSIEINSDPSIFIWIPPGFAHGFSVLSDDAIILYKCTSYYDKEYERGIFYADTDLNIDWKIDNPILSLKDKSLLLFQDIQPE